MIENHAPGNRLLWLALAGMFLLIVLANISLSLLHGHLAMLPIYDDVNYMADALVRLRFSPDSGIEAILASFIADPPHAPVTTLTGLLGFWLLGPEPIAAYIANSWVVLVFLLFLAWLSRPIGPSLDRALFIGTFLFVPAVQAMVMEFRPDLPGGLLLGIAAYLLCVTDLTGCSHRRRLGLAAICAAATVTKPSAVILVVPALFVAGFAALAAQWATDRRRLGAASLAMGQVLIAFAVLMTPFVLVWGRQTADYVYGVLVVYADVWATAGDSAFHLFYHSTGIGGILALGKFFRNGLILIVADLALMTFRRDWRNWRNIAYYVVVAIIYAAMAVSGEKTPYQGSFFYLPFVLAFAAASVRLIAFIRASGGAGWIIRPALVVILAFYAYKLPLASYYYGATPNAIKLPPIVHEITRRLIDVQQANLDNPACSKRPLKIVFTDAFPIPTELVRFEAAKVGVETVVSTTFMSRELGEMVRNTDQGDIVLISDPSHVSTSRWLPGVAHNPALYDHLQSWQGSARFDVGSEDGKPQWLIVNDRCNPGGRLQPSG
jgi:hypothetical protein